MVQALNCSLVYNGLSAQTPNEFMTKSEPALLSPI
mgnify:CR=1 FL=1